MTRRIKTSQHSGVWMRVPTWYPIPVTIGYRVANDLQFQLTRTPDAGMYAHYRALRVLRSPHVDGKRQLMTQRALSDRRRSNRNYASPVGGVFFCCRKLDER